MGRPIYIRLDEDVRHELEVQARTQGISLTTFLREMAIATARDARRARIAKAGDGVGCYAAGSAETKAFFEDWGSLD
jgi:hypothetical protein